MIYKSHISYLYIYIYIIPSRALSILLSRWSRVCSSSLRISKCWFPNTSVMLSSTSGVISGPPEFLAASDSMCSFNFFTSCRGMEGKSKND